MKLRTVKKYRNNWAFMETRQIADARDGLGPMLTRHRLIRVPWFGVFIHEIHRPDFDRDLHDHPWPFATFILSGGYREVIADVRDAVTSTALGLPHKRQAWAWASFHRMPQHKAHYIDRVHGRLVTLLFVGRRSQDWGFYTAQGYIPQRVYRSAGGVNPGSDESDEDYL